MKKFEEILGIVLSSLFVLFVAISALYAIYNFIFWDHGRVSLYGPRGEFYMAE